MKTSTPRNLHEVDWLGADEYGTYLCIHGTAGHSLLRFPIQRPRRNALRRGRFSFIPISQLSSGKNGILSPGRNQEFYDFPAIDFLSVDRGTQGVQNYSFALSAELSRI